MKPVKDPDKELADKLGAIGEELIDAVFNDNLRDAMLKALTDAYALGFQHAVKVMR